MKNKNLFWGGFFIIIAILILLNQVGVLVGVNIFSLIISVLMIPIIITSVKHTNFAGILFPLAIIGILYSEQLGIEALTPWPILGVALFLSIGLSFIIPPKPYIGHEHNWSMGEDIEEHPEDGTINISTKLAASVKYIDTDNLTKVNIYCSCAGSKIYFDNAKIQGKEAIVQMEISCSGIELYIPKTWTVENQLSCMMGGIEEKGRKMADEEDKRLVLTGKCSLSGVSVIYI